MKNISNEIKQDIKILLQKQILKLNDIDFSPYGWISSTKIIMSYISTLDTNLYNYYTSARIELESILIFESMSRQSRDEYVKKWGKDILTTLIDII